ncbi:MAG: preprotein translocase subunit YajC [Bacteroidia bacterium]
MNSQLIFLILFIAVFYIFIFLPQIRKSKKQKAFKEALEKGDKVVTTGGLHGKIVEIQDLTITLDVGNGMHLKFDKSAVSMEASMLSDNSKQA